MRKFLLTKKNTGIWVIVKVLWAKWIIIKPLKKKFLIYDGESTFTLYKIINKDECEILYNRYEEINFYVFFLTFLKSGFRDFKTQYKINFIKFVSPEFVLTTIDNDISFYKLKNIYSEPIYISIQNGMRAPSVHYDLFENKSSSINTFNVDYLFVFGREIKKKILENFKFNIIIAGSVLNNHYVYNHDQINENNSVLFISQHTMKELKRTVIFPENERVVFNILYNFCKKKKLTLNILPKDVLEKYYRQHLIEGDWKYINRNNKNREKTIAGSYSHLNQFKMVVFLYSTLGYEALSRGIKCACFPYGSLDDDWVKKNQLLPVIPFGYPGNYKNVGPFWSNMTDDQLVEEILEKVFNYSHEEWERIVRQFSPDIMQFDPGNSIINKVINENVKRN